jgi:alginate O-acetyltransferase complex protein AlgI
MLFNSYPFIFIFFPIAVTGWFLIGRVRATYGAACGALCSVFFYGYWNWRYVPLLLASAVANYSFARLLSRIEPHRKGLVLACAVTANLTLLGYYKYADFFLLTVNGLTGADLPLLHIILPLGISFFTFTQLAFLVDVYQGKASEYRFVHYLLFVTYFPHLIAGPILHHREMMPQFDRPWTFKPRLLNFGAGITIFAIGLAKKVLIADNLSRFAADVFDSDAQLTLFVAWGGVLAYAMQLYFDFSGYCDMAIGLSKMLGVRLPLNFNSPYKSANITDFWRRWHMTLSRFLRDYLYIPLGGNRHGTVRRYVNLMITMVLGGLWHGAGWPFVVWGTLHGAYLVIHHGWLNVRRRIGLPELGRIGHTFAVGLTFFFVTLAWVFFRAKDLPSAMAILSAMFHWQGAAIPEAIVNRLPSLDAAFRSLGIHYSLGGGEQFVANWGWVTAAALIAFFAPNTQQIMHRSRPALEQVAAADIPMRFLRWRPTRTWAIAFGVMFAVGILALTRPSQFLYFQF